MTCVPKHIACGWYSPEIDSGFVASSEGCTLSSVTETKSRKKAGGTFFRSKDVGLLSNDITVSCTWQVLDGTWIDYDSGSHTTEDIGRVKVVVIRGATTETYYQTQTFIAGDPGGEPPTDDIWTSAIPGLRTQLNSSQIIRMPTNDNVSDPAWDYLLDPPDGDDDHIAAFTATSLSGGSGADGTVGGLESIRTGPAMALAYITTSETLNDVGDQDPLEEVRYWNGACWKLFDSTTPDCVPDPENPDCTGGPEGDC